MTRNGRARSVDRRTVLATAGAVGVSLTGALAGCAEGGDDEQDDNGQDGGADGAATIAGSEYPAVDEWLTETDVGGADDTYDGSIVDLREESRTDRRRGG